MDNNNLSGSSRQGNNFFSGFLLGVLVGAAVVFLLATKKGKRILKAISEEGAENISNLLDKVDKSVNLDEVLEEESVADGPEGQKKSTEYKPPARNASQRDAGGKVRRFFRGISRHVN